MRSPDLVQRHNAHLPTSLKGKSLLSWVRRWRPFVVGPDAFNQVLILNISSLDNPRRTLTILRGRNDTGVDFSQRRKGTQTKYLGGFAQRDFATLSPFTFHVNCNLMPVAEATDARLRPAV